MALQLVSQVSGDGCFIAALAMLIGKSYDEALKIVFPKKKVQDYDHALRCKGSDRDVGALAAKTLKKVGFKTKKAGYKKLKSLLKYARKNVLLIIRWGGGSMCHAVVYDAETKRFLDPSGHLADEYDLRTYQRNLDSMYYVEPKAA